jgi:hypothetical protein
MANKQSSSYEYITGSTCGLASTSVTLGLKNFTDSGSTTGRVEIKNAVPAYAIRVGVLIETLETFNAATSIGVGLSTGTTEWTSGAAITSYVCTTLGYKIFLPYGATTVVTGLATTATESVWVALSQASAFSTLTTGKVKVTVIYLATQTL